MEKVEKASLDELSAALEVTMLERRAKIKVAELPAEEAPPPDAFPTSAVTHFKKSKTAPALTGTNARARPPPPTPEVGASQSLAAPASAEAEASTTDESGPPARVTVKQAAQQVIASLRTAASGARPLSVELHAVQAFFDAGYWGRMRRKREEQKAKENAPSMKRAQSVQHVKRAQALQRV